MSRTIKIVHLYPELLNLYGDSGNILCLRKRLEWRGIGCELAEVHVDDHPRFSDADLVFIGGGSDREQRIVCDKLLANHDELSAYVADGGVLLAVCGGYQLLGESYAIGNEKLAGLGLVNMSTVHEEPRLISNIVIESPLCSRPIVGYENHGGRTHLGSDVTPLGKVLYGHGNDGTTHDEGCLVGNIVGSYIHGPLLPKNPQLADWLLARAMERRFGDATLEPLDDAAELEANRIMVERLLSGKVKED